MSDHKKQPPKKVFDIMRPGKAPAAPTSRPIIVGHKPEVKDEMVGGNTAKVGDKDKRPLLSALAKVTIQPPKSVEEPASAPALAETPAPAPEPTPTPAPAEAPVSPVPQLAPAPIPEAPKPGPTPVATLAVDASVNLPDDPAAPRPKPLSDQLLEAAAKEPENPNPMMQHGDHVYVSHHTSKLTLGNALLIILLVIVLTAVAVNFLIDADVIKTDLGVPHTNLL